MRDLYFERMMKKRDMRTKLYLLALLAPLCFNLALLVAGAYMMYLAIQYMGWI